LYSPRTFTGNVLASNRGKFHTPKYHRANRLIRLTEVDVQHLLAEPARVKAQDEDCMFRIKTGTKRKSGPIRHGNLLGRVIQPAADDLAFRTLRGVSCGIGGDSDGGSKRTAQGSTGTVRAKPELLYPGTEDLKLTRPTGSGNLRETYEVTPTLVSL
jgi:hypothetical protein